MRRSLILASVLASFLALNGAAESSQSGSDSASGKPAPQSQPPAPAAPQPLPAAAGAAVSKDSNAGKDRAKEKKKPKRIWTEEEISAVGGSISVVGDQNPSNSSSRAPAASDGRDAAYYRGRLAPLRQQIEDLDREIRQMKNSKGNVRENVDAQVQIRETRREKIQKQVNEIEEDARRHGIAPGDLR
jgi:chromosome segregation ATPase